MRFAVIVAGLAIVIPACQFDPGGVAAQGDGGIDAGGPPPPPPPSPDARPADAGKTVCSAGDRVCQGRLLRTCAADGSGFDPSKDVNCAFTCTAGACAFVSNLPIAAYMQCDASAPALTPAAGATVSISGGATPTVHCSPDCGDGKTTSIASKMISQNGGPPLALFCLSKMSIPRGVTVARSGQVSAVLGFFVDGAASIAGTLDVSGGAATQAAAGGGGPGGGTGAGLAAAAGATGQGAGAGKGGKLGGKGKDLAAGGGGGAGFGGGGGSGGAGESPNGDARAAGGGGGGQAGGGALSPLVAGSGGGSGASGACGSQTNCGWPGGGGGGGVQIASRTAIDISGTIDASGGDGFGETSASGGGAGGGGGGGSGGAILLEAPMVTVTGRLDVDGGSGGASAAGGGGSGATGSSAVGATGAGFTSAGQGGGGGGGGGGRIRINATNAGNACYAASPSPICTTHAL